VETKKVSTRSKEVAERKVELNNDYQCWRVSGNLDKSIESCPEGNMDKCMSLQMGETCSAGKGIKL
jgi:hypothetical protein